VKNKKEFKNDSINDSATSENDVEKKTLTDLEYLSHFEDVETFREISDGLTEASIDFYNLKNNTDHENYKKILNSKLGENFDFYPDSYNDLFNRLTIRTTVQCQEKKHKMLPIKEMPILRCIKKLKFGSYGQAFVVKKWKDNERNRFQLEDDKRDIKDKYYVLKSCIINYKRIDYSNILISHIFLPFEMKRISIIGCFTRI
jgi:hypothetical protein